MNDAPPAFRASRYVGSLVTVAALTASITVLIILFLSHGTAIASQPDAGSFIDLSHPTWLLALVAAPLLAAAVSVVLTWAAIRLIRVISYERALRGYCERELQRAGIPNARAFLSLDSIAGARQATGTRGERIGDRDAHNVVRRLLNMRRAVLLGRAGAGKSVTIFALARRLSSPLASARAAFGLKRIPALLSLPGLASALAAGSTPESYIATQFANFGADGLAARTHHMLRSGELALLCDDYDMLNADARELVDKAISVWSDIPYDRCQLVITCDSDVFERDLDDVGSLAKLSIERLEPLPLSHVARMLTASMKVSRKLVAAEMYARDALARPVGAMLSSPAIARALADTYKAGNPSAWGYGELLRQSFLIKQEEALTSPHVPDGQEIAVMWGAIGASLQSAQRFYLPLEPALTMGECAARWLNKHPPLIPVGFALQQERTFDPSALEHALRSGVAVGVLRRQVDGLGITFTHPIMRDTAAAYWLDAMDNSLGRLNSALLTAHWITPVTLWASARPDALDIAQRIYRLSQSPESVASRAGFSRGSEVAPAALALALAVAVEGAAPRLLQFNHDGAIDARQYFTIQQELRDLLDSAAIMAAQSSKRGSLIVALRQVHLRIGPSFLASVRALIALDHLDRMARAQLTLLLGLTGAPDALEELLSISGQPDHTIRQAARQALVYAGVEAIPTLQRLAISKDAVTRRRASEALALVTAVTPEAAEVAGTVAISSLRSADARERHAAVTTLSAIRASEALDALIARLDDTSLEVQIAAALALGLLGAPDGLAALRKHAHTEEPALRRAIAEALGATADPQSLEPLLGLLADKDRSVRAAAATALGAQGDKRAAGPLREAAQALDPWVRQAAQAALRRLTGS